MTSLAEHRPATRKRRFTHDDLIAVDLFSGFGGLTQGIKTAGFTTIMAANHNRYKVAVHERNHPEAEHWIADLVDPESSDYHSARDLPAADLLVAGVSCVNHSCANSKKAYAQGLSLLDLDDPDFDAAVTRSERDRATANCFPAGTIVVARRGMVPIEDLTTGDEVLTHRNRWRRVTGTLSRHSALVTVKGRGHTALEVTANHRFLSRSATRTRRGWTFGEDEDWTFAGELVGHAWQSPAEFPIVPAPAPPEGWHYDHHFWWTVGRWLGDGWIRHCNPSGAIVGICCGYTERAELDGRWDARVTEAATTVQYELRGSGSLARWLMAHFGEHAHGKTIPSWALAMDADHQKSLVEGYMSADGCSSLDGRRGSCATVSRKLAVGLKLLLQSLGHRPTLRCRPAGRWQIEGRTGTTRPTWILQWMSEQRRTSTIATIDGRCVGVVREVINEGHEAEVFDIEVDEDHSFVADGMIVHNCVLHYAEQHHPRVILVECTTELQSWGPAIPGRPKVGDGSTYRWWLRQFGTLGYRHRVMYLNSMFFGVPQSRDRLYIAFWDKALPTPDLDHQPHAWCSWCDSVVEARWTWRTGLPPTGTVRYGKQYDYRCPRGHGPVSPPTTPSLHALDLTDLGTRIGDRKRPLAAATMARAERCRRRFAEFPAVPMPAKAEPSGGLAVFSSGVIPFRKNTIPTTHAEAMPTVTSDQIPGVPSATETVNEALLAGWFKQNGAQGTETAPHPVTDPLGTLTSRDTTGLLMAEWQAMLSDIPLEDCHFRMMGPHEVGRGCGFDVDFPGHDGTFIVWGSARDQVDGYGNAVSPAVGEWIGTRLRAILHEGGPSAR